VPHKYAERKAQKQAREEKDAAISKRAAEKKAADLAAKEAGKLPAKPPAKPPAEPPRPAPSAAVHGVPSLSDVDALSVKELKRVIQAASLDTEGCLEKAELRAHAREAIQMLQPKKRKIMRIVESDDEEDDDDDEEEHDDGHDHHHDHHHHHHEEGEDPPASSATTAHEDVGSVGVKLEDGTMEVGEGESPQPVNEAPAVVEAVVKVEDEESAPPAQEGSAQDGLAAAVDVEAEGSGPPVLEKGTRLELLWEEGEDGLPMWYPGVVKTFNVDKGQHRIWYDDGEKRWEDLGGMQWRLLSAKLEAVGAPVAVATQEGENEKEEESVVAIPSEAQAERRLTRTNRRHVKLQQEDVVDGLVRCPGCCCGIQMSNGGCNVTTCYNTAQHNGRYYYFCAHCRAECPDGESMCVGCPSHNDRQTRKRVQARQERARQTFLASNSADNPCEVED
jgi:hypothetical protein